MMSTKVSERLCDRRDVYRRALADPIRLDVAFYASRYVEALEAEVERLQARVQELEAALGTARTALIHTRAFATLRSLQIQMDEALLHIAAVSAETPEGHTRMNDGITPSEPTEWLEDLNAVSAETEDDS